MPSDQTTDRTYQQRVADAGPLRVEMWAAIKDARDAARNRMIEAEAEHDRLNDLLTRMRDAGMADHLPTLAEVREAWNAG